MIIYSSTKTALIPASAYLLVAVIRPNART